MESEAKPDVVKDEQFLTNTLALLFAVQMPISPDEICTFLAQDSSKQSKKRKKRNEDAGSGMKKVSSLSSHVKVFSDAWTTFLQLPLSMQIYKKVLLKLPERIIPHLVNPLMLSDFLTDSYNRGGVVSLLVSSTFRNSSCFASSQFLYSLSHF